MADEPRSALTNATDLTAAILADARQLEEDADQLSADEVRKIGEKIGEYAELLLATMGITPDELVAAFQRINEMRS